MARYKIRKFTFYRLDKDNKEVVVNQEDILDSEATPNMSIPKNLSNRHYQEYLEWAKSNTPDVITEGPTDWEHVRGKRDALLRQSDWTMTTGATIDQAQWSAYREKLRDIPQTYKGKATSEIVWPTAPSTKGPNS